MQVLTKTVARRHYMESFFRTHTYLVEHSNASVRRPLMDEIDWSDRLIGIKGMRGVGKTTFLLQYAREHFPNADRRCLYVNMNNFYFQGKNLVDFATEFVNCGGKVLLIDQVFKQPDWSQALRRCHDELPSLQIVFTGSSVMRLKEENPELNGIVKSYNLRGFSFREYLNLVTKRNIKPYCLQDLVKHHETLVHDLLPIAQLNKHFQDYLHHGFYPFFLENRSFSETLLKTMNMMTEVDILLIKQIDLKYLPKIKKLFYLLATQADKAPNISQLAIAIETSRATVMNYIKYLSDARLINIMYPDGQDFPKKPSKIVLHNPNLVYAISPLEANRQELMETFFINALWKDHTISPSNQTRTYRVDSNLKFKVCDAHSSQRLRQTPGTYYAQYNSDTGRDNLLPLWLFGLLY